MIKLNIMGFALALGLIGLFGLHAAPVSASALPALVAASASKTAACEGLTEVDNTQDCNNSGAGVTNVVATVVKILSYLAGVAAIIMVILSGSRYITSGGDANKVSSAKSSLIYALVGIAVAVLAQVLVHFIVNNAYHATDGKCHDGRSGHAHLSVDDPQCK